MNALTEFSHSLRFIATATRYPLKMGAIWPSSPELAKAMADQVDPQIEGPIIELGSGTGSITKALIERGIDESRLILIESHPHFLAIFANAIQKHIVFAKTLLHFKILLNEMIFQKRLR